MPSTRPVPAQLPQSCLYVSLCASRARSLSVSRSLSPLQCSVLHHNGSERKFPGGFSESARGPLFVSVCRSSLLPRPPSSAPLPVCLSVCLPACLPLRARVCVCAAQASEVTWWPVMARWRRRSQRCICHTVVGTNRAVFRSKVSRRCRKKMPISRTAPQSRRVRKGAQSGT